MKVSMNLAQQFSNVDLKSIPRDELLERIGAQLGAVEEVIDWAPKFDGAVIVKVVSCEKHSDADKLNVCQVDDGSGQTTQVVCGAPNAREGIFAVWLKPGVTVPNSRDKDPFVLDAREIRGVVSNGMLASPHELGLSDNHDGILEITAEDAGKELVLGEPLSNYFGLDDLVIDCENKMFTHRPDCFGNMGVARELAGIFGVKFEDPEWYWKKPNFVEADGLEFSVSNINITANATKLVPRFMAVAMSGVNVQPSPVWLQTTLARVGIKPINNVVDVTNYVMHLTGQPLHAFDYDKIIERSDSPTIFPRLSQKGEKLLLLGQKEIELTGEEIVIATDKQAVALAGVMGGSETEVDENTKSIIIECATFDMYSIRRASMRFGLFTDAVTRFNKGQSPLQNDRVIAYAMKNMTELCGAKQASDVFDIKGEIQQAYLDQSNSGTLEVKKEFINARLGSDLSDDQICSLLQNVHFAAFKNDAGDLEITAPFWRMDIEQAEDIVEEVGRLYGFDKLPVNLPPRPAKPTSVNTLFELKKDVRIKLKSAGANEVLTYSFVNGGLMKKTGTEADKWAFHIRNALSPSLQYYRTALIPSLLDKIHMNIKAGAGTSENEFALYEIGKTHVKGHNGPDELPIEFERLALVVAADEKTAKAKYHGAAYYQVLDYVKTTLGFEPDLLPLETNEYPVTSSFQPGRAAMISVAGEVFGVVGEFSSATSRALKLPSHTAGFELELSKLLELNNKPSYRTLADFPKTEQDLTLEFGSDKPFAEIKKDLSVKLDLAVAEHGYLYDLRLMDIFQGDDKSVKRFTFRIALNHPNRTMSTNEATSIIDKVSGQLKSVG
ncbi:MAG: phenylalanine--tRNA ligase subunit beta [bacterium]|nr:phenylalanine--tRNA ligase subunit beta [bacterium]